jgi:hypothetical protein
MREHIVGEIQKRLAGTDLEVRDVRFELPTRSYDSKVDSEVLRPRLQPVKKAPPPPGPPERMRAIEHEAASVEDDELRRIIERTRKRWDL